MVQLNIERYYQGGNTVSERKEIKISEEEILRQQIFINEVRRKNDEHFEKTGVKKKHLITTFGCQMNENDSETLFGMLALMGYEPTPFQEDADLIIYNTCAVRENAELKVYGNLGALKHLKEKKEDLVIAVCGCMMQQKHVVDQIKKKYRHVNMVFGTHNLYKFPEMLKDIVEGNEHSIIDVWDIDGRIVEGLPSYRRYDFKAFVNIMYGCNNFCTYCIVPYTRGRERSRDKQDIIDEITKLVANGAKEIILLGQNVNSYGNTLDEDYTFAMLLKDIDKIEGLERLRFMTSHPKDLTDDVIDAMAECKTICNSLHLPVQAGSSRVLSVMNRKYDKEHYLNLVAKIRAKLPNIALSTDIMIGFPGETEEDFLETVNLVEKVRFDAAFTFIYSVRKGTKAETMEDHIPEEVKKERFERLLAVVNRICGEINSSYQDKVVEVLVESVSKKDSTKLTGRTSESKSVNFAGTEDLIGKIVKVHITEAKSFSLNGKLI